MRASVPIGFALSIFASAVAPAQDVPGIEICTVDKTMERRTSCLQSNVDFLVKTISRLRSDQDQKLTAANREIAALRASVVELQKSLVEIKAAKPATAPAAAKDAPAVKDVAK